MAQKKLLSLQLRRFLVNGVFVTLLDFIILNILAAAGVWFLLANIISTSIAVIVSYRINKKWVFQSDSQMHTFIMFVAVTLFGAYILQGSILYLFHEYGIGVGSAAQSAFSAVGIDISREFLLLNISKVVATFATAVWNFVLYKKVVFTKAVA